MDYYSLFWGPGEESTAIEPWRAFSICSSTLALLLDSEPFHGLLLTVLGPQTGFIVVEPQGAHFGHQESQFGPILARFLEYYLVLGVP